MNLKGLRASRDLSQQEMADRLGISRSTYSMIEQGRRNGSGVLWTKLRDEFGLSPEQVFEVMKEVETEQAWHEAMAEDTRHALSNAARYATTDYSRK